MNQFVAFVMILLVNVFHLKMNAHGIDNFVAANAFVEPHLKIISLKSKMKFQKNLFENQAPLC